MHYTTVHSIYDTYSIAHIVHIIIGVRRRGAVRAVSTSQILFTTKVYSNYCNMNEYELIISFIFFVMKKKEVNTYV